MTNLIATDAQTQEIDSGLIDLFEITLPNGTVLRLHPGVDDDLTNIQFRTSKAPTNPVSAGNFVVGNTYTIVSGTGFTSIGASNNNAGTSFVATGVGSGNGVANQTDYTIIEYTPFPMSIDGLDLQADGASSRPSLTVANLGGLFGAQLGDYTNDDLVGCRILRRQTLKKYLYGESGDASPPIEFRKQEYIIDRIASESNIALILEVAMPFDLENIKLPRRVVVGKYCSWKYQQDGCSWAADSAVQYGDYTHNPYFNIDDSPLLDALPSGSIAHSSSTAYTTSSYVFTNTPTTTAGSFKFGSYYTIASAGNTDFTAVGAANNNVGTVFQATGAGSGTGTATETRHWQCLIAHTNQTPSSSSIYWKEVFLWDDWVTATSYAKNVRVRYGATGEKTIWKCIQAHTSSAAIVPERKSSYWVREDSCGKTMQSCKCRFGFIPVADSANNEAPKSDKNTAATLPFGSFPGTLKF